MDNQPQQPPQEPQNDSNNLYPNNQPQIVQQPVSPQQPSVYGPSEGQQSQPQGGEVVTGEPVISSFNSSQPLLGAKSLKSRLPLIVGVSLVVLLLAGGAAYALLTHKSPKPGASSGNSTSSISGNVNCGKITVTDQTFSKSPYTGCFDQHFTSCSPAQIVVDNESSLLKGTINQYYIESKQGSSCLVQWQYVTLPSNTSWDGKTITCPYDNSKEFQVALSARTDFTGCSGPLLNVMTPNQSSSNSSSTSNSSSGGSTTQTSSGYTVTTSPGVTVLPNQ